MKKKIISIILSLVIISITLLTLTGCNDSYVSIPAGYVGRILTSTGWDENIIEAGQVNLGNVGSGGQQSVLVLQEVTTVTILEPFLQAENSPDKEDHRLLTKSGTPLTVDLQVKVSAVDKTKWNDVFVEVTPKPFGNNLRVQVITLNDIYVRFAQMDVRGKLRSIFAKYKDYHDVMENWDKVNQEVQKMIVETFQENEVPLKLQNSQLGNVKPDATIWAAENQKALADSLVYSIEAIGQKMKENPEYVDYLKWQTIKEVGLAKDTNTLIIAGGDSSSSSDFAAAQYILDQLKQQGLILAPTTAPQTTTPASK
jgi:hypothetical protein